MSAALLTLAVSTTVSAGDEHATSDMPVSIAYERSEVAGKWRFTPKTTRIDLAVGDQVVFKLRKQALGVQAKRGCYRYDGGVNLFGAQVLGERKTSTPEHTSRYAALGFVMSFVADGKASPPFTVLQAGTADRFVAPKHGHLELVNVDIDKLDEDAKRKVPGCTGDWKQDKDPWISRDETDAEGALTLTYKICQAGTTSTFDCPGKWP